MKNLSGSLKGFIAEPKLNQSAIGPASNNSRNTSYVSSDFRQSKDPENPRGSGAVEREEGVSSPMSELTGELIVGHGVVLKGAIKECRAIEIKGEVEAEIECDRLVIEPSGQLKGSFVCEVADIGGECSGTGTAKDRVMVRSTGCLSGELSYGSIQVELGGRIRGKCVDSTAAQTAAPMELETDLGDLCDKDPGPRERPVSPPNGSTSGTVGTPLTISGEQ
ncbi:MAG: polymer-forming cytoskeletal protein [Pseudomonadota bacterium]|nr:polymer-forming cytoskeletal protein [Pseudomonadota bacterium]